MTRILVDVPARVARAPRAAEPLADLALTVSRVLAGVAAALGAAFRSRPRPTEAQGDAAGAAQACRNGIGWNKG